MAFAKDLEAVVLGTLQEGGRHGYEIARRIREIDEGALNAREGRLYPLLHRLEAEGLIAGSWMPQAGRPPRKVYALTAAGYDALAAHRAAWRQYVGTVESVLNPLSPPGGSAEGRNAGTVASSAGVPPQVERGRGVRGDTSDSQEVRVRG